MRSAAKAGPCGRSAPTPMTNMSPDAQRIAIAKAVGFHRCGPRVVGRSGNQKTVLVGIHPRTSLMQLLPDYLTDLNEMHEAEAVIHDGGKWNTYYEILYQAFGSKGVLHVPAAQRAEAFLRTIGKWEAA